jgi:hypothetical protein
MKESEQEKTIKMHKDDLQLSYLILQDDVSARYNHTTNETILSSHRGEQLYPCA